MIEVIKDIATVLGCVSVAFGLVCSLSESTREWISQLFAKKQHEEKQDNTLSGLCDKLDNYIKSNEEFKKILLEDMDVQKEFSKDQCRNIIKDIFYRYCDEKKIPLYAYKTANSTFETYSNKLGGNSFICLLWREIQKWEIDYTHSFEEDE